MIDRSVPEGRNYSCKRSIGVHDNFELLYKRNISYLLLQSNVSKIKV